MSKTTKRLAPRNMPVFTQKRQPKGGNTDVPHEDFDHHQEITRSGFADMLHDTERNEKYYEAIKKAIEKMQSLGRKAHVLDIGTGTGLLSIFAAKCGADSITACEAFKPMAECCLGILNSNNVANKVKVIPKTSRDLTVGENGDMKHRANILVTEVFDTELIGEGALPTFIHAQKHLLEEDSIIVPDSAVTYVQVVESPLLRMCNKLNDLADEDGSILLRTPQKMIDCPGSSSLHDIQLSRLPLDGFRPLSDVLPIFRYDWSGRVPIVHQKTVRKRFKAIATAQAHAVFVWWELNMDAEATIVLSCAPWWNHPDVDLSADLPEESIPWRDHWMQAVYFLPDERTIQDGEWVTLVSGQDLYSVWFYLDDKDKKLDVDLKRPMCNCGVHMVMSRTHLSYLNDGKRSKNFLSQIKEQLVENAVVLDLNGSSLMGLATAKLGAKKVYIWEDTHTVIAILEDYIRENGINNVEIIAGLNDDILSSVTNVTCDPQFNTTILPWENLRFAHTLYNYRDKLRRTVSIIPESFELWCMPVEFLNLQKIRIPLRMCQGIDMTLFDNLIETSRQISDSDVEAQPLWEYPNICRGVPRKMMELEMSNPEHKVAKDGVHPMLDMEVDGEFIVNGFAIWANWRIGGVLTSCGPIEPPVVGQRVKWDRCTMQAVKLMKLPFKACAAQLWNYQVVCDLQNADFDVSMDVI